MVHFDRFEGGKYEVSISPLLSNKTEQIAENILFTSLQLTQLSEFYKITITDGVRSVQRVMIIPTEGLPEEREKAVVNSIVKDRDFLSLYSLFTWRQLCS